MAITTLNLRGINRSDTATSGQVITATSAVAADFQDASAGISEADTWRLTTDFTGTATPIASNWERSDTAGTGYFGTGMSQSSGVFTFPSTGWYFVTLAVQFKYNGSTEYLSGYITGTRNNGGAWTNMTGIDQGLYDAGSTTYAGLYCSTYFDVTDTGNHKLKFDISMEDSSATCVGSSTQDYTSAKFIRLGDT